MYSDSVLLESRSARSGMAHRVEVLDKVKALAFSTGSTQATTRDVANYFEVALNTVEKLVSRHREELESNGLSTLRGADLQEFETDKLSVSNVPEPGYPQLRRSLTLFNRRAVLNVAMLLRDSDIARRVRVYLLDVEGTTHPHTRSGATRCPGEELRDTVRTLAVGYGSLDRRVSGLESAGAELGAVLQELGPVIGRISERLERMDSRLVETERRTEHTEKVVCSMSQRLADMGEEMREMRGDLRGVMRATGAKPVTRPRRS
ncbi:hypothetical protein OIE63_20560 [Streptomyces sp. NBC_01795]|uniref:hypothetical protein n=1 Tax=unclassified Streptomyces TaxID=2593676 RepID=UPI002DD88EA3|nr:MULTISPECIES: hypothetical protein [unclassified Streptomyces]WSA93711.1 hypothetical protein OIE63_20560 [Streptomyces sp. NBC_01795]WSB78084.1 hypothetical protein OHB04_21400 [Streptomyces sp. NBC_01775]WSS13665.1 hypothetical protein OG533_18580 [Streptomyces sp. NBC_01186]